MHETIAEFRRVARRALRRVLDELACPPTPASSRVGRLSDRSGHLEQLNLDQLNVDMKPLKGRHEVATISWPSASVQGLFARPRCGLRPSDASVRRLRTDPASTHVENDFLCQVAALLDTGSAHGWRLWRRRLVQQVAARVAAGAGSERAGL